MRAGASRVRISTIVSSLMPAPASYVSIACKLGESSLPIAAAMPPCAQSVAAPLPSRVLHRTVTRIGAQLERRHQPGDAGSDDDDVAVRTFHVACLIARRSAEFEHALDRAAGARARRLDRW